MTDKSPNYARKKFDCKSELGLKVYETVNSGDDHIKDAGSHHDYQQNPAYGATRFESMCPATQPVSQRAPFSAEVNGPVAIPLMNAVRIPSVTLISYIKVFTACR